MDDHSARQVLMSKLREATDDGKHGTNAGSFISSLIQHAPGFRQWYNGLPVGGLKGIQEIMGQNVVVDNIMGSIALVAKSSSSQAKSPTSDTNFLSRSHLPGASTASDSKIAAGGHDTVASSVGLKTEYYKSAILYELHRATDSGKNPVLFSEFVSQLQKGKPALFAFYSGMKPKGVKGFRALLGLDIVLLGQGTGRVQVNLARSSSSFNVANSRSEPSATEPNPSPNTNSSISTLKLGESTRSNTSADKKESRSTVSAPLVLPKSMASTPEAEADCNSWGPDYQTTPESQADSLENESGTGVNPRTIPVVVTDTVQAWTKALECIGRSKVLGCDTEGDLRSDGRIDLWQIATREKVYILDFVAAQRFPSSERTSVFQTLKSVMENTAIEKIFHDCRADADVAFHTLGIKISNVVDTQVLLMQLRKLERELADWSKDDSFATAALRADQIDKMDLKPGLNEMLQVAGCEINTHKSEGRKLMERDKDVWIRRPISKLLLDYAAGDVRYLITARHKLLQSISDAAKNLAVAKCEEYANEFRRAEIKEITAESARKPIGRDLLVRIHPETWKATFTPSPPFADVSETEESESQAAKDFKDKELSAGPELYIDADLEVVLDLLPTPTRNALTEAFRVSDQPLDSIYELVFDFGSCAEAHVLGSTSAVQIGEPLSKTEVRGLVESLKFGRDNRAGLDKHIHRISRIPNKNGETVGITIRIARVVQGIANALGDVFADGKSILILGLPGQGKTTLLRDISRFLSVTLSKRCVICDTSCEIGGDGDIPHPAIGKSRRFQVDDQRNQHNIMLEIVKNHTPDVIIIDELGDRNECTSAKAIAQRGVQLIATAHGSISSLLSNPDLNGLVGGLQSVILGDDKAKMLRTDRKTRSERAGKPTCDTIIELQGKTEWAIYRNVTSTVDKMLAQEKHLKELRWIDGRTGKLMGRFEMEGGRFRGDIDEPRK
ncbi:Uncharacterized protein HDU93_007215 [Gonapodya sp. JEL0774]|nr:Uncharacterized protein HDU93_007215 [Gonapodya sp. JEL0774]